MLKKKHLVVIGGATATGKTKAAIKVAQHFQTEIISADSRQFYREMSIGTAKQTKEELDAVKHHFVNSLSIEDEYSVGDFERDAIELLDELFQEKEVVVMAGGSGLFIRAVCNGLDEFPEVAPEIDLELRSIFEKEGIDPLQAELKKSDPDYASKVDMQNPVRLIRALGVCRSSGKPFSSFRKGNKVNRPFVPIHICLEMEREKLYERINSRVEKMVELGLLDEAKSLFPQRHLNALQTVGYQELFDYFSGNISQEEAIELIKRNSRRYAKRQMTWFRKDDFWKRFEPGNLEEMVGWVDCLIA